MAKISWKPFSGTIPRMEPRFLPQGAGQVAENVKLFSQALRPFRGPQLTAFPKNSFQTKSVHRYVDPTQTVYWFDWATFVQIVKGPIASDSLERRYYTGDGVPKKTASDIAVPALADGTLPARWWNLGVKIPVVPTVGTQVGGSGNQETVNYLITHVTGWGEESGPSPGSADFTAFVNRTSLTVTRATPNVVVASGSVDPVGDTFTSAAWQATIDPYARIQLTTSSALCPGLSLATDYWIIPVDANKFKFGSTYLNALDGIAVDITGAGTGNQTVTQYAPDGRYNISGWRIYRTNTGNTGADFQFVAEVSSMLTTTYVDAIAPGALGDVIPTLDFDEPPSDLHHVVALSNGFLAGLSGKQLCFSEIDFPYAWPKKYRRTISRVPVGLGVVGSTVVVATDGKPEAFSGVDPGAMQGQVLNDEQSCPNANSIVSSPVGVAWASPDGVYLYDGGSGQVLTKSLMTKEDWQKLNPDTMIAAVYEGRYYFLFDQTRLGNYQIGIFDPAEVNLYFTTVALSSSFLYSEILSAALYLLINGEIQQFDADPNNPLTLTYKTSRVIEDSNTNKSMGRIQSDFGVGLIGSGQTVQQYNQAAADIAAYNAALFTGEYVDECVGGGALGMASFAGGEELDALTAVNGNVAFSLWADQILVFQGTVQSNKPFRLPGGFRARSWETQVKTTATVTEIAIANSARELGDSDAHAAMKKAQY